MSLMLLLLLRLWLLRLIKGLRIKRRGVDVGVGFTVYGVGDYT